MHALVIGGTGMLKNVTTWLHNQGYKTSVIGRTKEKLAAFHGENYTPIQVDYHDTESLVREIEDTISRNGPIELVVSWIHSTAPNALPSICKSVEQTSQKSWELYHVLGSRYFYDRPSFTPPLSCHYHSIFLGFQMEHGESRWLTHDEISNGVIRAIKEKKQENVVGTVTPWEKRPR